MKRKELKVLCNELGYTEEQLDEMFKNGVKWNWKIDNLIMNGADWRDLSEDIIRNIPNLEKQGIEFEENKKRKKEEKKKNLKNTKNGKNIVTQQEIDFETETLNKIDNKIKLSEDEVRELVYEHAVENKHLENISEYQESMESIVKIKSRYFKFFWIDGEPEATFWDNEYPKEVEKKKVVMEVWAEV